MGTKYAPLAGWLRLLHEPSSRLHSLGSHGAISKVQVLKQNHCLGLTRDVLESKEQD